MKLTNKHDLPQPLVTAMTGFEKKYLDKRPFNRISVTELIMPALMKRLRDFHFDEIEEDVSDRIWALLGSAVHAVLEHSAKGEALVEERLNADIEEFKITGQADHYQDGILSDYKVTSAYGVSEVKREWEEQLNALAYLYEKIDFPVKKIQIVAILRDWAKSRINDANYPQIPIAIIPIERWSKEKTEEFIIERVKLHRKSSQTKIEEVQVCSNEERWKSDDSFAIMKEGNKRATSVFETHEVAITALQKLKSEKPKDKYSIIERKGEDVRCMSYCSVSKFCPYWKNKVNALFEDKNNVAEIG